MKICIVTAELAGPSNSSGVGSSCYHLAKSLVIAKHDVEVLFCARECPEDLSFHVWQCAYQTEGIHLSSVKPRGILLDNQPSQQMSHLIYETLKNRKFDLIIFSGVRGIGFFCVSAKKSGLYFQETRIWTMFERPTEWDLEQNNNFITKAMDLPDMYMEKQTCLLSDKVLCFSESSAKLADSMGFTTNPSQAAVLPLSYLPGGSSRKSPRASSAKEICFFGRRDLRRGYATFLQALKIIKKELQKRNIMVTLLGPSDRYSKTGYDELKQWILNSGIPINLVTGKDQFQSIEYLKKNQPLVVLPSIGDNSGHAVAECIENGVSFICSDIKIFKEIVGKYGVKGNVFFASESAKSLARKMLSALKSRPAARATKKPATQAQLTKLLNEVSGLAAPPKKSVRARKVSVCITHRDRGVFLDELIRSLEPAMAHIAEILVYDDFSLINENKKILRQLEGKYDGLSVIRGTKKNGPSYGRNVLAKKASEDYILFIDDDNILNAENFLKTLPLLDGKTDFLAAPLALFDNEMRSASSPLIPDRLSSIWSPIGSGLSMNIINNHIGDANMIMRRKFFEQIGGFSEDLTWGEDIEILVRASFLGGKYHFFTESFVFYRDHKNGLSKQVDARVGRRRMWKRFLKNVGMSPELHQFLNLFGSMAEAVKDQEAEKRPIIRDSSGVGDDTKYTHYYPPLISLYRTDLYMTTPEGLVSNLDFFSKALINRSDKFKNIVKIRLNTKQSPQKNQLLSKKSSSQSLMVSFDVIAEDYCSISINQDIELRLEKGSNRLSLNMSSNDKINITSESDVKCLYICNVQTEVVDEKI